VVATGVHRCGDLKLCVTCVVLLIVKRNVVFRQSFCLRFFTSSLAAVLWLCFQLWGDIHSRWLDRDCATVTHGKTPPASAHDMLAGRAERNPKSERPGPDQNHRPQPGWAAVFAALMPPCGLIPGPACAANANHAIAMHGEPALPPGFVA